MYKRATIYFALALLVAVLGFYPSYFSRLGSAVPAHHFHAVAAMAWMLLLITQAWLMRTGRVTLHRKLGKFSLVLVPIFIVSGFMVVHRMLASTGGFSMAFGSQLAFLDFTSMAYFAMAYLLALRHRRRVQLHARWMATTAVLILPPAIARLLANFAPGVDSFVAAVHLSYAITELVVLALILDDRRQGKILPPYMSLLGVLLVQQLGFELLPQIPVWAAFTRWFGAI